MRQKTRIEKGRIYWQQGTDKGLALPLSNRLFENDTFRLQSIAQKQVNLPFLPNLGWHDCPHNIPVAQGTLLVPFSQFRSIVLEEQSRIFTPQNFRLENLDLWDQEMLSGTAIQEVTLCSIAECDFLRRLATEDDQVGKVTAPFLNVFINARTLAEDAA